MSACIKAPEQHRKNRAFSEQLVGKFFEDGSLEKLQKLKKLEEHGGADQGENQIRSAKFCRVPCLFLFGTGSIAIALLIVPNIVDLESGAAWRSGMGSEL